MYIIFGPNGQVGREVIQILNSSKMQFTSISHELVDIASLDEVDKAIGNLSLYYKIKGIINCAAYTSVDLAEGEGKREAHQTNSLGTANLATVAKRINCPFVHISTDYVFNGEQNWPYREMDTCVPLNEYGRSKLIGESESLAIHPDSTFILRTSWVYSDQDRNFLSKIVIKALNGDNLRIVDDQVGQPTWARDIAYAAISMVANAVSLDSGVYHYSGEGSCSWYDFARKIIELAQIQETTITPIASADFVSPAQRPKYSVLSHEKWNACIEAGIPLHPIMMWDSGLEESRVVQNVLDRSSNA